MIDDRFYTMRGQASKASGVPSVMPDNIGSLVSIVVQTPPTKTEYYEGDYIDLSGIEILGVYADDSTIDITPWCTVQVRAPLALSSTTPIVWFQTLSTTFTIQVTGRPVAVPSSAVHIFHFENDGYDALGNYKNSSDVDGEVLVHVYAAGCRPRMGLTTMAAEGITNLPGTSTNGLVFGSGAYMKTPTHYHLLKEGASITVAFWSSGSCSFCYGQDRISSSGSVRYWRGNASATSADMEMSSGSGVYYSGQERQGPAVSCSGTCTDSGETWHHYAFVVDHGATMYAFVDGGLVCQADLSQTNWNTTANSDWYLLGTSDEMIFADTALWTANFVPPAGPYNT